MNFVLQLILSTWEGGYNLQCQNLDSAGEADVRVRLAIFYVKTVKWIWVSSIIVRFTSTHGRFPSQIHSKSSAKSTCNMDSDVDLHGCQPYTLKGWNPQQKLICKIHSMWIRFDIPLLPANLQVKFLVNLAYLNLSHPSVSGNKIVHLCYKALLHSAVST